jgi:hypothetical protein
LEAPINLIAPLSSIHFRCAGRLAVAPVVATSTDFKAFNQQEIH